MNQYFYEKLKSKISKINNEITEANKKLALKESNSEMSADKEVFDNVSKAQEVAKDAANLKQAIKFDSVVTAEKKSPKMERKSSAKSIPIKNTNFKKRHWPTLRRRHSSLQPYKLRSKSLPAGVRRKFGFGSFVDVVERQPTSVIKLCRSKSTVKSGSKKCSNTRLKHQKVEHIKRPSFKTKKSSTPVKSVRSKTSVKNDKKILPTKLNKSNMAISSEKEIPQRKAISQNNIPYANLSESLCLNKVTPSCSSFRDVIEDVKQDINVLNKESKNFNRKPNPLVALAKQPIPFTICASTSKSFNLGLNIQQVLSMVKHKRRTITLQEILKDNLKTTCSVLEKEPEVNTLFISKARSQIGSEICPAREENDDCLSCITDHIETRSRCTILSKAQSARCQDLETKNLIDPNSVPKLTEEVEKFERPEDVWVIEQPDSRSELRKTRSRCTCFPTKQCVDYNKVLRQYTGWRLPIAKSEVFNQDLCHAGYRPRLTFTNYNGNQLYPIPSQENVHRTIETNHDGMKAEMMKTHNDLMKLHRKYAMLQEQIAQNNIDDLEAQAELDALESEISSRELEYKDIMNSYNQVKIIMKGNEIINLYNYNFKLKCRNSTCS